MAQQNRDEAKKPQKSSWWRTVLGEYPTGVTLITSNDGENGDPVGMVVGTFSAVSEEPPLISFMATKSSYNYGRVKESGSFVASVLGAGHEALCRAFAGGDASRFQSGSWAQTASGRSRLSDAVAWFDADIVQVVEAGDHDIVIAQVNEYGVGDGDAGMPLLFLKGGYGSFTVPKLEFNTYGFGGQLRLLEVARAELNRLATRVSGEAYVATVAKDSVVVLARANIAGQSSATELIGQTFPFAAPVASVFAAWSNPDRVKLWEETSRHLLGSVDREFLADLFERVRSRGYSVSVGTALDKSFDRIVGNPQAPLSEISELWRDLAVQYRDLATGSEWFKNVSAIQVPIFGEDATTLFELFVTVPEDFHRQAEFGEFVSEVMESATRITLATGGIFPNDYPRVGSWIVTDV